MDSHSLNSISRCMGWGDPRNMKHLIVRGLDIIGKALNQSYKTLSMAEWSLHEGLVLQINILRCYKWWATRMDDTFDTIFETIISYADWDMLDASKIHQVSVRTLFRRDIYTTTILLAYGYDSWYYDGDTSAFNITEPLPEVGRLLLLYKFDLIVKCVTGGFCLWFGSYDDLIGRISDWGTAMIINKDVCYRMNEF